MIKQTSKEHYEKYEKLAQDIGVEYLKSMMPADESELKYAFEKDQHLNYISLKRWDMISSYDNVTGITPTSSPVANEIRSRLYQKGFKPQGGFSISDAVCVLKHVAVYHVLKAKPEFYSETL